jgi:hypothetical protein
MVGTPWLISDLIKVLRMDKTEKSQINVLLFVFFDTLAVAVITLQLFNWLLIKEPWPFFIALTLITAGAFQQFVLLVRMGLQEESPHDA